MMMVSYSKFFNHRCENCNILFGSIKILSVNGCSKTLTQTYIYRDMDIYHLLWLAFFFPAKNFVEKKMLVPTSVYF